MQREGGAGSSEKHLQTGRGKACAKHVHLQGQEMGKKEVGVRVLAKKRKESDWFKVKFPERNLEEAPHPKQTYTLF